MGDVELPDTGWKWLSNGAEELVASTLYLVGTPIGNLGDLSYRARWILSAVDVIFAEDTRVTSSLLRQVDIARRPLERFSPFDLEGSIAKVIGYLQSGSRVAFVSDAGMPSISDPGSGLGPRVRSEGFQVRVVPGPTAESAAVALGGAIAGGYIFVGFLPTSKAKIAEILKSAKSLDYGVVFYVAPHDLRKVLNSLSELGVASLAVIREMTKLYEEVIDGAIDEIVSHFSRVDPRGEFVVTIEASAIEDQQIGPSEAKQVFDILVSTEATTAEKAKKVSKLMGLDRGEVYDLLRRL
ncbi:MAG: 16S rRNA (cytidine(1402)-2'-O)-methyltransferase [Actinomycetota bacterium]|nr:16S rRNA (cytidine(1402)-2'-O)-methyltransferase [Actinomycetota bacterium]